jgi:hypothetical protein
MLDFLGADLGHFLPVQVMDDTYERTSSRFERFFGAYKYLRRHEVLLLAVAVKGIRLLGQMALARRSRLQIPPLSCWKSFGVSCGFCAAGHFLFRLMGGCPTFTRCHSELIWIFGLLDLVLASLCGPFFLLAIFARHQWATELAPDLGDTAVSYMPALSYITVYIPEQLCPSDSQTKLVRY